MRGLKRSITKDAREGLPEPFVGWFAARAAGARTRASFSSSSLPGRAAIAPTGKTLASFLPSLVDLIACGAKSHAGIQTLYVSPLKALAVDIANLADPVTEMGLPIKLKNPAPATPGCRAASGSGSVHPISYSPRRSRSRLCCSIAMLRASHGHHRRAARDGLDQAGDLLALDLARLRTLSPDLKAIGLSATVARPSELAAFLDGHEGKARAKLAEIVDAGAGPKADNALLDSDAELH